ncbi:hypothetical protein ABBQ32_006299 [Trebouxia sp. C0010 RCD-2024]
MQDVIEGKDYSFPNQEEKVLKFWDDIQAFQQQLKRSEGKKPYVFYDGPPFATGLPHYGHLLAGTLKDIVTRYATATGHYCPRQFGWDCHGLPVEFEIDKKLNIHTKDDVLKMGIDKYNEECRSIVMRYSKEWQKTVERIGRWIDFDNGYKTLDPSFMESVWWVFTTLHKKGLVYQGFKVMPYSTGCTTPLSNFEAGLNYKDVPDPAVKVSFPLDDDEDNAEMVIWTTTPWTLPSNLALCVHPDFVYVKVKDPGTGRVYVVAEALLHELPGAVAKESKKKDKSQPKKGGFEVLKKMKGSELVGKTYKPMFPYFSSMKAAPGSDKGAFRVVADGYVTADAGTGVVHQAPFFGEDDYRVCCKFGIVQIGGESVCPVDASGNFTSEITDFAGQYVKAADKQIIAAIKGMGRLVDNQTFTHSYPFCWRSETPLIYRAVPSWFVEVTKIKDQLLANNAQTHWVPTYVKEKRFHNWLADAHDWAVSRSRFWGTPLPVWVSKDMEEVVVIGSVQELEELSGHKVTDLHRHFIDHITIPSKQGKGDLHRVEEVFDCWFESGSMPYGQLHYPFENKEFFEGNFPADFVAEGIDQTRGWFYTLMVLSTALFGKPAFKSLVCNGLILAEDGKKMSKRLQNYPDPTLVLNEYGADALRLYLINSPVVRGETLRFKKEGVFAVVKDVFLPWYNAYRFLVQNVLRLQQQSGITFDPTKVDVSNASNVLDRWINAASRSLTSFVTEEMNGYRLYTVVPVLVKFINNLTNIYVRYNRRRLKGSKGTEDTLMALVSLYDVLLTVCKVMSPFTPFFTEQMYQNLRRCQPQGEAPESVHYCDFPTAQEPYAGDAQIQLSVERMQTVIELSRTIREKKNRPLKNPLKELVVVHTDKDFLADIEGELKEYVVEEVNVRSLQTCSDPLQYCTLRAEPDYPSLGKRLGKAMAKIGKAVKGMTTQQILDFEAQGRITLEGESLGSGEIRVLRDFRLPEGASEDDVDANGDGEVLAVLDLGTDDSLVEAGLAREVVNRVQKLRKKAGLVASDVVDVYLNAQLHSEAAAGSGQEDKQQMEAPMQNGTAHPNGTPQANGVLGERSSGSSGLLEKVLSNQGETMKQVLGRPIQDSRQQPSHAVVIARSAETIGSSEASCSFEVILTQPTFKLDTDALCQDFGQDIGDALNIWLQSREPAALQKEAEKRGGKVSVVLDSQKRLLQAGRHFRMDDHK